MSSETDQAIRPELSPSERLIWSGVPQQGIRLRASDALMVPFSLMWGGFAVFWEYSVVSTKAPFFFKLWGIPFVLAGLYITVGRFFADSYQRARTYYALTDQRVLIVGGLMNREVKSLSLQSLTDLSLTERSDRSGSITFGPTNSMYGMWAGTAWPGMSKKLPPSFDLIPDARKIYDLIRNAQRSVASRGA